MKLSNLIRRLLDEANAGDGGASAGAGVTTETQTQTQGQEQTQQPEGNVLDQGKPEGGEQQHFIPEKFHVKSEDGNLDLEASSKKMAESYAYLEKQRGEDFEPPPAAATDYTITPPDAFKDVFQADDPVLTKMFTKAHELGMSQKQVDGMMSEFFEFIPGLQQGNAAASAEEATTALRDVWKDEGEFKANIAGAYKAVNAFAADGEAEGLVQKYGNDPAFIKFLANVSREMKEDTPAKPTVTTNAEDEAIDALMDSEAYRNPRHDDHIKVSQQVKTHFEKKYGTAAAI